MRVELGITAWMSVWLFLIGMLGAIIPIFVLN